VRQLCANSPFVLSRSGQIEDMAHLRHATVCWPQKLSSFKVDIDQWLSKHAKINGYASFS
jgi:hypothetical protein